MENTNSTIPIPQPVQLQAKVKSPQKSIRWGLLAALVSLTLFFAVSSVFIVQSRRNEAQIRLENQKIALENEQIVVEELPTSTPLPIPTNTPEPTIPVTPLSTWLSHRSTKYKYYFLYPPDWKLEQKPQADTKILEYLVLYPETASSSALPITLSYTSRTYSEALALNSSVAESITVASVAASRKVVKNSEGEVSIHIIVPNGTSNSFIFVAKDKYKGILDQIISTFFLK